jgi:hypothetical protein
MLKFLFGYEQQAYLDGVALEGTRDFDIDLDGKTFDVTHPDHNQLSTLLVRADVTITILVLWKYVYDKFAAKFNKHPPEPMTLSMDNIGEVPVSMVGCTIGYSPQGFVGWKVKLKPMLVEGV